MSPPGFLFFFLSLDFAHIPRVIIPPPWPLAGTRFSLSLCVKPDFPPLRPIFLTPMQSLLYNYPSIAKDGPSPKDGSSLIPPPRESQCFPPPFFLPRRPSRPSDHIFSFLRLRDFFLCSPLEHLARPIGTSLVTSFFSFLIILSLYSWFFSDKPFRSYAPPVRPQVR